MPNEYANGQDSRVPAALLCSPGPHPFFKRCLEETASGPTPRLHNEGHTQSSRAGACPSGRAAETRSVWQLFLRFEIRLFTLSQCKWGKLLVLFHSAGDKVWPHFPLQMKGEGEKNKWKEVQPSGVVDNILKLKHSFCLHLQWDYRSCQASLSSCWFSSSGEITERKQKVPLARPWLRVLNAASSKGWCLNCFTLKCPGCSGVSVGTSAGAFIKLRGWNRLYNSTY